MKNSISTRRPKSTGGDLVDIIKKLDLAVPDPNKGLPEELFLFISRVIPLANVDLLIRDRRKGSLLIWRTNNICCGPGWHIPGGVMRYGELFEDRIRAVARKELGADVKFDPVPLTLTEFVHSKKQDRGHAISILYACELLSPPRPELEYKGGPLKNGFWAWHKRCPKNLLEVHKIYADILSKGSAQR